MPLMLTSMPLSMVEYFRQNLRVAGGAGPPTVFVVLPYAIYTEFLNSFIELSETSPWHCLQLFCSAVGYVSCSFILSLDSRHCPLLSRLMFCFLEVWLYV